MLRNDFFSASEVIFYCVCLAYTTAVLSVCQGIGISGMTRGLVTVSHSSFPAAVALPPSAAVSGGRQRRAYSRGNTVFCGRGFTVPPHTPSCQVCLQSGLNDMGLRHCHLVAGGTHENYNLTSLVCWQFDRRYSNISYDSLKPVIDYITCDRQGC